MTLPIGAQMKWANWVSTFHRGGCKGGEHFGGRGQGFWRGRVANHGKILTGKGGFYFYIIHILKEKEIV